MRRCELLPDEPVDVGERLVRIDPDTSDLAVTELGLHDRREADVRRSGVELVDRLHTLRSRRRQAGAFGRLPRAELAARGVDGLDRITRQAERLRYTGRDGRAFLPERQNAVGPDSRAREHADYRRGIVVGLARERHRKP